MPATTPTVLDRYIGLSDRAIGNLGALDELKTIFAPDATVRLYGDPITGLDSIAEFYRQFLSNAEQSTHYWTITKADAETLEAQWVAAIRFKDGRLAAVGGFERARLNADGLIVDLRNYPSEAES